MRPTVDVTRDQMSRRVSEPEVCQSSKRSNRVRSGVSVVITKGTMRPSAPRPVADVVIMNGTMRLFRRRDGGGFDARGGQP